MYTANTTLYRQLEHAPLAHLAAAADNVELEEEVVVEIEIEFEVYGSYHPGTREDPPEYPELEITKVTTLDQDGKEIEIEVFDDEWEKVDRVCWAALEDYDDDYY